MKELGVIAILTPHFIGWVASPELRSLITSVVIALVVYFTGGRPPGAQLSRRVPPQN